MHHCGTLRRLTPTGGGVLTDHRRNAQHFCPERFLVRACTKELCINGYGYCRKDSFCFDNRLFSNLMYLGVPSPRSLNGIHVSPHHCYHHADRAELSKPISGVNHGAKFQHCVSTAQHISVIADTAWIPNSTTARVVPFLFALFLPLQPPPPPPCG